MRGIRRVGLGLAVAWVAAAGLAAPSLFGAEAKPKPRTSIFDFEEDAPPQTPPATTDKPADPPVAPPPTSTDPPADNSRPLVFTPPAGGTVTPRPPVARSAEAMAFKPLPPAADRVRAATPPVVREATLLPVPDPKAQEAKLRQVKEQFKTEYRATGAERVAFAITLMKAGAEARTDPETAFVLLREARDLASSAGEARVGLAAARHLAGRYSIDLTEMGLGVLQAASRAATTPDRAAEVAEVAMALLARAAEAKQFDTAIRIAGIADASARAMRSTPLANNIAALTKDLRNRKAVADKLPAALETLSKNLADPEASTVVGKHLCLDEGNWAEGLAFLAKCNDTPLKNLATKDLAAPTEPVARADLGAQWWTAAQSQPVTARLRMQERAAHWYALAEPALIGAKRDAAAQRVAAATKVLPTVVLMSVPVAADPAKARRERDALSRGAEPLAGKPVTESTVIDGGKTYALADKISVPTDNPKIDITLGPGTEIRGGKIDLAGKGRLILRGSADKPVVLRNVEVIMELGGLFDAEYAVLDGCTFRKGGRWYSYHSSKWQFKNCTLYKCKFSDLNGVDYGVKLDACRLIGMTFPEIRHKRDPAKAFNHLSELRRDWNTVRGCEFTDCALSPTMAWCAEDSAFVMCKFVPGESFEGDETFVWRAFVAETVGESPQASFDARAGTRGKVRVTALESAPSIPRVGEKLIPEITYATRAVVQNE